MKTLVWSAEPPHKVGFWFHLHDDTCDPSVVRVYKDGAGEWSLLYGDLDADEDHPRAKVDYTENWLNEGKARWCFIPLPREP